MPFWCLSPVRVVYHGSFRENLESSFRGLGLSYVISQLDETHASLQNGAFEMLQFWCLSPVRVAYHGSFRENLGSAFWGFGLSYHNLIRQMQVFKKSASEMLQFWCLSPVRVAYHGSFRENLESAFWGVGVSYCSLIRQMQVFKKSTSEVLQFWCLFDASPQSEWFITAHLKRIWNHHFGALDCHMSYHNLMKHMQVFKTEHLKCCSFDASPQSEWLITAHLERIWGQHFGALDCHITTWLGRCKSSKRSIWNVAVLMPLPCQSGLSRLI